MPTYVVTGASSFVGQHLVPRLRIFENVRLRLLIHQNYAPALVEKDNVVTVQGDLLDLTTLRKLIVPESIVINLAYLGTGSKADNLKAISNLVQVCRDSKAKRLIHCSTAAVVGKFSSRTVDENTPCNPVTAYEQIKHEIETFLLSTDGLEVVILRPSAVFGPSGKNLFKLANSVAHGNRVFNYFKSCLFGERRMNAVCVGNVVAALTFLANTDKPVAKEIFIVSDDDFPGNNYRFIEAYLMKSFECMNYPLPHFRIPSSVLSLLLRLAAKSNTNPNRVYQGLKLSELGFRKPVTFESGLADFAKWYKKTRLARQADFGVR